MTTCVSELMELGWARMQAEGIAQGRDDYFKYNREGQIIAACALGALVLGSNQEVEFIKGDLYITDICPALSQMTKAPDGWHEDFAKDVIWNINDGWWITDDLREQAVEIEGNVTTPILLTIAWLKERGL